MPSAGQRTCCKLPQCTLPTVTHWVLRESQSLTKAPKDDRTKIYLHVVLKQILFSCSGIWGQGPKPCGKGRDPLASVWELIKSAVCWQGLVQCPRWLPMSSELRISTELRESSEYPLMRVWMKTLYLPGKSSDSLAFFLGFWRERMHGLLSHTTFFLRGNSCP